MQNAPILSTSETHDLVGLLQATRNLRANYARAYSAFPHYGDTALHGLSRNQTRAGWKCGWQFGIAQCGLIMLPRGLILTHEWATAVGWAENATNGNLPTMIPGRRLPLRYAAFNPAAVDDRNVLIRAAPEKNSISMDREWTPFLEYVLWLRDGHRIQATLHGNDPRGIWLDAYTMLAVYNRPHTRDAIGFRHGAVSVHMYARNLSAPGGGSEVRLHVRGMKLRMWEKNWAPFVHGGQLYMSYVLMPEHVVLACDFPSGACNKTFATPAEHIWRRLADQVVDGMPRLSTPPLLIGGRFVSVGHFRTGNAVYIHFWFEMEPAPPFRILRSSRPFRFFSGGRHAPGSPQAPPWRAAAASAAPAGLLAAKVASQGHHAVQYVAGLHLSKDRQRVVLSYGVGDQGAMRTTLRVDRLFQMLRDDGEGTLQYRSCMVPGRAARSAQLPVHSVHRPQCTTQIAALCVLPCYRSPAP